MTDLLKSAVKNLRRRRLRTFLTICSIAIGLTAVVLIFTISGYYQAIGKNTYANIISIGRGFVFQFIFTLALPPFIGTTGVFLSLPLAELITMMIIVAIIVIDRKNSSLELIENY